MPLLASSPSIVWMRRFTLSCNSWKWTLFTPELNYNTHNKQLLIIRESFQTWQHYLEGSASPVDIVTDHKNLKHFAITELLTPGKPSGQSSSFNSTWLSALALIGLAWNLIPSLDAGISIPKRGIRAILASILTISSQYLHRNSLLCPSGQHISQLWYWAHTLFDASVENLHNNILSALPFNPLTAIHICKSLMSYAGLCRAVQHLCIAIQEGPSLSRAVTVLCKSQTLHKEMHFLGACYIKLGTWKVELE